MKHFFFFFVIVLIAAPLAVLATTTPTTAPSFISLSDIPAFANITNSLNLSEFLNAIYGLSIGLASVLAVAMIMYGGLLYMGGDSITEKKVARQKIMAAVLGLLLVLAPAIVFGIIDKRILSLEIDTTPLAPTSSSVNFGADGYPTNGTWESTNVGTGTEACTKQGGTVTLTSNGMRCTGKSTTCPVDDYPVGSTRIAADGSQDSCCLEQANCSLVKQVRGQNSCKCQ